MNEEKTNRGGKTMFDFRIILLADGNQIIDRNLKTPFKALTPLQMLEYIEMDMQLEIADIQKKKDLKKRKNQKLENNIIYKIACFFGIR